MQQNLYLSEDQVVLCFSPRDIVQLPANLCFQYFTREDTTGAAPVKITITIGNNDWREFSLTIAQVKKILYFLRKVITKRAALPDAVSDKQPLI